MSTLRPFNIKIKLQANIKGKNKEKKKITTTKDTAKSPKLQQLSFSSSIYFKTLCCVYVSQICFKDF